VWDYLRDALRFRAPRHLGHNPAGGAMIVALLTALAGTAATGFMMTTDAWWGAQWVEDLHEALANATLVLVGLHVVGVLFASIAHGENLVRAMITGRKRAL
jgi:cytochrome b